MIILLLPILHMGLFYKLHLVQVEMGAIISEESLSVTRQEDANIWLKEKDLLCFFILHKGVNLVVWPCNNKWIDRIDWKWAEKTENQQFFLDVLEKGGTGKITTLKIGE